MSDSSLLPFDQRPIVVLFADLSALSTALVESLVASLARVRIISSSVSQWRKQINHLSQNRSVDVVSELKTDDLGDSCYFMFVHSGENEIDNQNEKASKERQLREMAQLAKDFQAKALVVLPYNQNSAEKDLFLLARDLCGQSSIVAGIVLVGELYGPRMNLSKDSIVTNLIKDALSAENIVEHYDHEIYPAYIPEVSHSLVRSIFSFGAMGKVSFMYSKRTYSSNLAALLKEIVDKRIQVKTISKEQAAYPEYNNKIVLKTNLKQSLKDTVDWFKQYGEIPKHTVEKQAPVIKSDLVFEPVMQTKVPKKKEKKRKKKIFKMRANKIWAWTLALVFVIFVSSPLLLALGASSLWLGTKQALAGHQSMARVAVTLSATSSTLAEKQAKWLSGIPLLNIVYHPIAELSHYTQRLSFFGERGLIVFRAGSEILQKSLTGESYDLEAYSEKIALELDLLYREMGFLQSEIEDSRGFTKKYGQLMLEKVNFDPLRTKILSIGQIIENLPLILGQDSPAKYLILFQNNMELRPTGGFIGSYALITFDQGRVVDLSVSDVYSADGQLKGHIEPPKPIKDYLGEANWYLRDSNWDPDFPSSASTAEWFLEKEIGERVDGVIAVDLEFARKLLSEIGEIYLADYESNINSENLYEITQYEVEKDFFPGSQKKAAFLTALSRQLLTELISVASDKYLDIGRAISSSLEGKHIQVFLHNKEAQRSLADLGWDGGVYQPICFDNCYADWLGLAEANVGVNKANYFIERRHTLDVVIEEREISKTLSVFLTNNGSVALGNDAVYKSYLRALTPQSAIFSDIEIGESSEKQYIAPEIRNTKGRTEAGVYFEVKPGETVSVTFTWKEKVDLTLFQPGEYRFFWRKQAGTTADPVSISFNLPNTVSGYDQEMLSLTNEGILVYNTNLARDYSSRIFW